MRSPHTPKKAWRFLYALALFVWLIDFTTKTWAVSQLLDGGPVKVLGTFLQLNLTRNSGAAFGFATGSTIFLSLLAVIVSVVINYYAPKIDSNGWAITLGLLLGGVLGNLTDRLFREPGFLRGHVIDWIELPNWPIFNVADSAIVIASVIAITLSMRNIAPIKPINNKSGGAAS